MPLFVVFLFVFLSDLITSIYVSFDPDFSFFSNQFHESPSYATWSCQFCVAVLVRAEFHPKLHPMGLRVRFDVPVRTAELLAIKVGVSFALEIGWSNFLLSQINIAAHEVAQFVAQFEGRVN